MLRIRFFEDKVAQCLVNEPKIKCPVHLYTGQEAIAAGVCANLGTDDFVYSTHRSHGHYIAKGGDIKTLAAELYGKETGCSRGRGGSMHLISPTVGFLGSSAIVGGSIPLAVGSALAFKQQENKHVAVAFFGDGATNEGIFYESLNFASLMKLPVVFICENNLYSTHMPIEKCLAVTNISEKAKDFGMFGITIDGNNVPDVYLAAKHAIGKARNGEGPSLLECKTYRWYGHVGPRNDIDVGLRSQAELDYWKSRCPIKLHEQLLTQLNIMSLSDISKVREDISQDTEKAFKFARESPDPDSKHFSDFVFQSKLGQG
jgi:pyruvate dehydrogenase E1 component alpha subunit